jgi:chemotaxis protein methyltransferase CheR
MIMIRDHEIDWLLNDLLEVHGYDFTHYTRASLKRRINRLWALDRFPGFSELRFRLHADADYVKRFVEQITVNVTEMFRDPVFYKTLRTEVLPTLAAKPFIRIWHAGCSTGEEVYSMAILLQESNLLSKCLLYATDLNPGALETARRGIYPVAPLLHYAESYMLAGGSSNLSAYYTAQYGHVQMNRELSQRMVFSTHNLVSDRSFNEFDLILCRNVLIYFDRVLQERVLNLFDESLGPLAYLALGSKETLRFSDIRPKYRQLEPERIWRKIE